jgi:hypothetical protein
MNTDSIAATAIALIQGPRDWGRSQSQTLSQVVSQAIVKATQDSPLRSEDFEAVRHDILLALRTPQPTCATR